MPPSVNQRATAWEDRHTLAMLALTLAVVALLAAGASVPPAAQIAVLVAAVALLGLPHGAFDAVIGEDLFRPRLGKCWGVCFSAGYLGLAAAVVGLWVVAPPVALASFFAAAAWHFGTTDARRPDAPSGGAWAVDPAAGLRTVLLRALPATLTTIALAAAAFAWLTRAGTPTNGAAVQVVFVGLSALTVPHMLLEVLAERR